MKKLAVLLLATVVLLAGIVLARAAMVHSRQLAVTPAPRVAVDPNAVARFSRAVQFRTVSEAPSPVPGDHEAFMVWLPTAYPRVHATMKCEVVADRSILYTWRGSDPSLKPLLLMGHYDVVPVDDETKWTQPPFSGAVQGDFIWGRGTLDDKISVIGLLEASEALLAGGWRPRRTILFAFGHDEERGGEHGAKSIAALLASRGVQLEAVLDEGGIIGQGLTPGVDGPVALVGTAEKGFVSVELSTTAVGGHSSLPPPQTAVAIVAAAVQRVQEHPLPSRVTGATHAMFATLAPEMNFGMRAVAANLWLTKPLLDFKARTSDSMRAVLHTTTAATMIGGGVKDNVVPTEAHAVINFRILPGETSASVVEHVRKSVDDPRVDIRVFGERPSEPSAESDAAAPQFAMVARTIRQLYPGTVVSPYLLTGATDARYYSPLSANIYRFIPAHLRAPDLERVHGTDERISVDDFVDAVRFYRLLIQNFGGSD